MIKDIKKLTKSKISKIKSGENVISRKLASFWKEQIEYVDESNKGWIKRGKHVVNRYRDTRSKLENDSQRRMNILWTNVSIMDPAIYSKCPLPIVDRKFLDRDVTGRLSSQILERGLRSEVKINGLHTSISAAVKDYLLPGRGQVWIRYEPEIEQGPSLPSDSTSMMEDELDKIFKDSDIEDEETPEEEKLENTGEQLLAERALVDYIDWKDFYMFPAKARRWEEVQAVGKRIYISKHEAIERFGEEIGSKMRSNTVVLGSINERDNWSDTSIFQDINERDIIVFEIWNKTDKRAYWISTGYNYLCDIKEDPLKLKKFFPCPRPLNATMTNDVIQPVPDYHEWQDQAIQIDELTQRIAMLARACKVAGTYDAANGGLKRLMSESTENQLIPVDNWAMHAEKGGVKGSISFMPLEEIQSCIQTLQEVKQEQKQDLDEITGLSDILRGTTDSRETLGGLRIKNNNAGTRLSKRVADVVDFACETVQIVAEVMCKHFDDNTLIEASGILYEEELQPDFVIEEYQSKMASQLSSQPQPQQQVPQGPQQPQQQSQNNVVPFPPQQQQPAQQPQQPQMQPSPQLGGVLPQPDPAMLIAEKIKKAIDLLRDGIATEYRIDIETDSTVFGDIMQEREDASEFLGGVTEFMDKMSNVMHTIPEAAPFLGKALQFAVRKYRTGRDLESEIDVLVEKFIKKAKDAAANPQPDPEQQKAQAELQKIQLEAQAQKENDDRAAKLQESNDQREFQLQQADDQRKMMMQRDDDERENKKAALEMSIKEREFELEKEKMYMEAIYNKAEHEQKMKELTIKASENEKKRKERKSKVKAA